MNKKQIKAAEQAMIEWLSDSERLGRAPAKIEQTLDFELDGLKYYIFKYRKDKHGDWFIGVAGGFEGDSLEHCGHIFSGMTDLYEDFTALELGKKMARFIREFLANQAARSQIDEKFKLNLKYISCTEVDPKKIARQFVKSNTRYFVTVGQADIPSGRVVVADPLCYLASGQYCPVLEREIPAGTYPAEVALFRNELVGIRMCTARLKIKPSEAVRYEAAQPVPETAAAQLKDGPASGFPVEAGMMCFCDSEGAAEYQEFLDGWHEENPDKNHYDDYFQEFFAESDKRLPQFQREGGDFIEWENPNTGKRLVMIASGFGDGFYQSFWGFDKSGEVCELIVPMVDPDLFES